MATLAEKLTRILFLVTLFIFPLGELGRFQINNNVAVTLNDLCVFVACSAWILTRVFLKHKKKFESYLFGREIVFVFIIFTVSLILNIFRYDPLELGTSYLYTLRWLLYAMMYFVVSGFDKEFKKIIKLTLLVVGAIIVVGGFVQYFYYPYLRNLYYLGWDEHLYRIFSSFFDPNFAGVFFVLYLLFLGGMYLDKTISRVITGGLFVLTFLSVLLTYSRSAFIALVVSSILFLWIIKQKKYIFVIIVGILGLTFFLPYAYQTEGTNFLRIASISSRLESSRKALVIFTDNPLFGIGFNAYRIAQRDHGFLQQTPGVFINHAESGTDNSILFVLATTGLLGITFYFFMWYRIFSNNFTLWKEKQKIQSLVVILSLTALFISSFFINSLFYPFLLEWIWIQVALTENT